HIEDTLSSDTLEAAHQVSGPVGLIDRIAGSLDQCLGYISPVQGNSFTNLTDSVSFVATKLEDVGDYRNVVGTSGSLFYLVNLAMSSILETANTSTVFSDVNGNFYPSGHYCLTNDCFDLTVDMVSSQPMSTWKGMYLLCFH